MVVTHAAQDPIKMTAAQMREVGRLGGFVEHTVLGQFKGPQTHLPEKFYSGQTRVTVEQTAEAGAENAILATDLGQAPNPNPVDGLKLFVVQLIAQGITDAQIDLMTRRNPARLLKLAPEEQKTAR